MTIFIPEGYAQATLVFSGPTDTGKCITTQAFSLGEEGTLEGLCTIIGAAFLAELSTYMSDSYTLLSVEAISATESAEVVHNIPGDGSLPPSPPNTTLLGRKITNLRGRKHRGRNYWPGFLTDSNVGTDGTIETSALNGLQGVFDSYGTEIYAAGYFACILHNDEATPPTPITNYVLDGKAATQRRRMR